MNKITDKLFQKENWWHVGAIGLFLIVSCVYFYPALKGYTVNQGDVTNWVGGSQEIKDYRDNLNQEAGWTSAMFSGMPSTQISKVYEGRGVMKFIRDAFTLWLPQPIAFMFLYFLSFYVLALSLRIKPLMAMVGSLGFGFSSSMIIIIEAGHNTKALAIGFVPLVLAGLIYAYRWKNWILGVALSSLFMCVELLSNHLQITYYLGFILVAFGIVELIKHLKKENGLIKFLKVTGGIMIGYLLAIVVNYGNISGTNEYGKYTTRGGTDLTMNADGTSNEKIATSGLDREYVTAWSYGKGETFTFIVPNFKGGETMAIGGNEKNDDVVKEVKGQFKKDVKGSNQYWGEQPFTSGPVYLGVIVFFLAILALVYSESKYKWALLVVTLLTVMLSWGKNLMGFTDLFLDYLPGYNKFRAVTIILAVAQICVPLLGALFLHKLVKSKEEITKNIKPFLITSGGFFLLLLIFLAVPTAFNTFITVQENEALVGIADPNQYDYVASLFDELEKARISIFRKDVTRSIAFVIVTFVIMFAFLKGAFNKFVLAGVLGVLIIFDLGLVDKRYLANEEKGSGYEQWTEPWKQYYPYTAGAGETEIFNREVQNDPSLLFKVDSVVAEIQESFPEEMSGIERIRRMDWAKYRALNRLTNYRVMELGNAFNSSFVSYFHKSIGGYHGAKLGRYQELIEFQISKNNPSVLDMLNMKYQITAQAGAGGQKTSQFVKENPSVMGNVWFAKEIQNVANADEEIKALDASQGVSLTPGSNFPIILNGAVLTETTSISQADVMAFLSPRLAADGILTYDTIPTEVPFQAIQELDLSLIADEKAGTLNWAYDQLLDSSYNKIVTVSKSGRLGWDPNVTTVVGADFSENVSKSSYTGSGTIEATAYSPDKLVYASSSSDVQLAVFSEIYYPLGWKAFVDGEEVAISRVNYTLRAIEVPAGDHKIEFIYELESFKKSGTYAMIGSFLILLMLGGGLFFEFKRKELNNSEDV